MIKEGKIGVSEAMFLVVVAISNRVFFTAPAVVVKAVGTSGWYMALVADLTAIVFFCFVYLLLKRFPDMNLIDIFSVCFGKVLGFLFSFLYAGSFVIVCGVLLREFIDVLKVYVFDSTPLSVLAGSVLAVIMAAAFLGLETIARVARMAGFIMLAGLIALMCMAAPQFKLDNIFPVGGYGFGKTLFEGLTRSSAYSEVIVLGIVAGALQGAPHIKKAGFSALVLSGIVLSGILLGVELVFPYYSLQELTSPLYELARIITFGTFFQRMDPIFLFIWIITTTVSSSILFYCAVSSYCKAFKLSDTRPVIIPIAVIVFTFVIQQRDIIVVVDKLIEALRISPVLLFYILPAAALITAVIRKKKGGEQAIGNS